MNKKITDKNIQDLYQFTRNHYVAYYDVQTELVDHLANSIENIWNTYPQLTFEEARDKSFAKFGVFGFLDVVEAKEKQMNKKYAKILWRFFKEWFQLPKLLLTIIIVAFFYFLLTFNFAKNVVWVVVIFLAVIDMILASRIAKKAKERFKDKKQKWLLEDIILKVGAFSSIFIFNILLQFRSHFYHSFYSKIFCAILITLGILYSYISLIVIPKKVDLLLKETYPEYGFDTIG